MTPVAVREGRGPIVLGVPHAGTDIPSEIWNTLNEAGRALADTDWHVDRLYAGLLSDATVICAKFHRYVIDANRDPEGTSLYPGQNTTGLCPVTDFDGNPIYHEGREPQGEEIARRITEFHAPYHAALQAHIQRVLGTCGIAILFDCHSIRSVIPHLFEGQLPVLNIGTNGGVTCDSRFQDLVVGIAEASPYETILNGRFRGGWTTRHYGRSGEGVHAIQLEIAQRAYLAQETPPWNYDETKASQLRVCLGDMLARLEAAALANMDGAQQ